MLQGGLTPELIKTLTIIAVNMPEQRPVVQQRLLEESTKLLGRNVYVLLCMYLCVSVFMLRMCVFICRLCKGCLKNRLNC